MLVFALILGLVFVGLCVTALVRLAAMRRVKTVERLSAIQEYGFSGEGSPVALPASMPSTGLTRFVASLGEMVAQRFGGVREDDLRAELMAAGIYTVTPRTLLGYRVLAA